MQPMIKNLMFCVMMFVCGWSAIQAQTLPPSEERIAVAESGDSSLQLTNLAAILKEKTKVVLNWKLSRDTGNGFVAVERSVNGRDFELVALLKQPDSGDWYEWTDDSPAKGRNAYRIKHTSRTGVEQYSLIASTLIAGDISFKFYPNPVDNVLIVRTEYASDMQIIDSRGVVRLSQSGFHGLQTLNVSSLEKGIYILRVSNRVTGTVSQDKLLKN